MLSPKGSVSLSQRIGAQRRAIGMGRCRWLVAPEVRQTACHHALYFARRGPRFRRSARRLRRRHLLDERTRLEVRPSGQVFSGSCRPCPGLAAGPVICETSVRLLRTCPIGSRVIMSLLLPAARAGGIVSLITRRERAVQERLTCRSERWC
jgi:hypothetical protein